MEEIINEPTWKKYLANSLILMSFATASWEMKKIIFDKEQQKPSYEIVYKNGEISKISGLDSSSTKISHTKTSQFSKLDFDPCNKVPK